MRPAVLVAAALLASGCATRSYIDPMVGDPGGEFATEIVNVAMRGRSERGVEMIRVLEPSEESAIAATIPASLAGAGFEIDDRGYALRYIISRLGSDGALLRVEFLDECTAQFYRLQQGEAVKGGPMTIQKVLGDG